jgi:hypothetical protein
MVKTERLEELREMDQLTVEMANGRAFSDFFEGRLSFPPTYKLIPGTRYSVHTACMHAHVLVQYYHYCVVLIAALMHKTRIVLWLHADVLQSYMLLVCSYSCFSWHSVLAHDTTFVLITPLACNHCEMYQTTASMT